MSTKSSNEPDGSPGPVVIFSYFAGPAAALSLASSAPVSPCSVSGTGSTFFLMNRSAREAKHLRAPLSATAGGNCIKISHLGKSILRDYFQENSTSQRPFLLLRIRFPERSIFVQFIPESSLRRRALRHSTLDGRLSSDGSTLVQSL